jgi:MarR family transcriptional regulator, transcriptional regulator for hemolysin
LSEATLTHHLNGMDADGLVVRRRDPDNRRVHVVELTDAGEELFRRLRAAATAFDRRLRRGVPDEQISQVQDALDRLAANVGSSSDDGGVFAGLIETPPARR